MFVYIDSLSTIDVSCLHRTRGHALKSLLHIPSPLHKSDTLCSTYGHTAITKATHTTRTLPHTTKHIRISGIVLRTLPLLAPFKFALENSQRVRTTLLAFNGSVAPQRSFHAIFKPHFKVSADCSRSSL